jgi:hypothetical protein
VSIDTDTETPARLGGCLEDDADLRKMKAEPLIYAYTATRFYIGGVFILDNISSWIMISHLRQVDRLLNLYCK